MFYALSSVICVLIESDWNLKVNQHKYYHHHEPVLIESDWNLKDTADGTYTGWYNVLIESDWNLKRMATQEDFDRF